MNTRDDQLEEENAAASSSPGSATGLFFRSTESRPQYSVGNDEISQLLEKPAEKNHAAVSDRPDSADPSTNQAIPGTANPQENLQPQNAKPVGTSTRTANLTGIFHKVPSEQLEDLPPSTAGNRSWDEPSAQSGISNRAQETGAMAAGFTQIFQSLSRSSDTPSGEAGKEPRNAEPMPPDSWQQLSPEANRSLARPELHHPQALKEGEFTRLFQNLNKEAPRTRENEQAMPWSSAAPISQSGGFTQLLRTLSAEELEAEPLAEQQPIVSPYAAGEPISSGPGEFTRIISGSLLREAQGRTLPAAQQLRSPASYPASEIPVPTPEPPTATSQPVPLPVPVSAPILTPEQLVAPPSAAVAAPALPAGAAAIPAPQLKPQPPGKLQQYLPLLLIANLFVMLLILIAVLIVLLRR